MADYSYIFFNKTPLQMRFLGARGGKAYGRNQRARRALMPTQPQAVPPRAGALFQERAAPQETTAEALATLDAQFPWLQCAEKRLSRHRLR